jgi:hypothetical protein
VKRLNRTLLDEWAHVQVYRSETERIALGPWLHIYNHHRNYTAIGSPPINRATHQAEPTQLAGVCARLSRCVLSRAAGTIHHPCNAFGRRRR